VIDLPGEKVTFIDLKDFKAKAQESPESILGLALRKQFVLDEVKQLEGEDQTLLFTISTGIVDRDQDTINADGWKLENYLKNPVVLWAHDYHALPVAKAIAVWVENAKLMSKAQFTPRDLNPFGHMVYQMYLQGFLKATSVGFDPLKWSFNEARSWGVDFLEQELLEFSCVPVPANPEALIAAGAKGIDLAPLKGWAEETLDTINGESGLWLPKAKVERAFLIVDGKKSFLVPGLKAEGGEEAPEEGAAPAEPAESVEPTGQAAAEIPAGQKSGRVLSKTNEERLTQARDLITQVLDQLAEAEPAETEEDAAGSVSHKDTHPKEQEIAIDLAAIEPAIKVSNQLLDVDPETLKGMIKAALTDSIRTLTGRVD
jgi:HK97 family phage prohead protease